MQTILLLLTKKYRQPLNKVNGIYQICKLIKVKISLHST